MMKKLLCIAALAFAAASCASGPQVHEWTAQGYLTPGPTGEPEIIGVYDSKAECVAAGEAWMSRQVVGNPVYSNCLPVDRD